jgi:hypothetical protein
MIPIFIAKESESRALSRNTNPVSAYIGCVWERSESVAQVAPRALATDLKAAFAGEPSQERQTSAVSSGSHGSAIGTAAMRGGSERAMDVGPRATAGRSARISRSHPVWNDSPWTRGSKPARRQRPTMTS